MEIQINDFAKFIEELNKRNGVIQHVVVENNNYKVFFVDGPVVFHCLLFKEDEINSFVNNYIQNSNKKINVSVNEDGTLKTHSTLDIDKSAIWLTSHNFADKTTWWQESVMVSGDVMPLVSGRNFVATIPSGSVIIDLEHYKLFREDDIRGSEHSKSPIDTIPFQPSGHFFTPEVYGSGVILKRVDGFPSSGEYRIDYRTGIFEVGDDFQEGDVVASYNYSTTSKFKFLPKEGRSFKVGFLEVNTRNVNINSASIYFDVAVSGVVVDRRIYRSEIDVIVASVGTPLEWRDWSVLQWPYDKVASSVEDVRINIRSSKGMYIELQTENDEEYTKYDVNKSDPVVIVICYGISINEG